MAEFAASNEIKLTNASVVQFREYMETPERGGPLVDSRPMDEISLVFQKIEITDVPGKTSFADDWLAP